MHATPVGGAGPTNPEMCFYGSMPEQSWTWDLCIFADGMFHNDQNLLKYTK